MVYLALHLQIKERTSVMAKIPYLVPALFHSSNFPKNRSEWILMLSSGSVEKECYLQPAVGARRGQSGWQAGWRSPSPNKMVFHGPVDLREAIRSIIGLDDLEVNPVLASWAAGLTSLWESWQCLSPGVLARIWWIPTSQAHRTVHAKFPVKVSYWNTLQNCDS